VHQADQKIAQQRERATIGVLAERRVAEQPDAKRQECDPDHERDQREQQLAQRARLASEVLANAGQPLAHGRRSFNGTLRPERGGHNTVAMQKIRVAVIGVGYLGRFHAQKYAQAPDCELVAIVDTSPQARAALAAELQVAQVADYHALLGKVDAVSVVTSTAAHFEIARAFLDSGAHVLVEKPVTETVAQARALIDTAQRVQRVLQVGHLERFNAAILAAEPVLRAPRFIECQRLAPYRERGTDVNVVLDLMIHDLDIVQTIVGCDIESIDAVGTPVFSEEIDIANARIRFVNGCVANATASRVSLKTERKLRIFQDDAYLSLDLQQKILTVIRKRPGTPAAGELPVTIDERNFDQGDALREEILAFVHSIRSGEPPKVSGEDGLRALETAIRITQQVHAGTR
jgi:predicted dehydrogenase